MEKGLRDWVDEESLSIAFRHFPPVTSKGNQIGHRMVCHITRNWRGRPLVGHGVIIELIGATTTGKGLRIQAEMDLGRYPNGIKVSEEMEVPALERVDCHGEWNYLLKPRVS